MKRLLASSALALCLSVPAHANQWILDNFAGLPVTTGELVGNKVVVYPSLVKDANCTGGYSCIKVMECNSVYVWDAATSTGGYVCDFPPKYDDQRIAFLNVTVGGQGSSSNFGQSILFEGDPTGRNGMMDVFMSKVTIAPDWPQWVGYSTTNYDGVTFDAGLYSLAGGGKHVYLEDVTVACPNNPTGSCWAEAALDVKPKVLQAVRLKTNGGGRNTLKLWGPGPHYLVDSEINNTRWISHPYTPEGGASEGGLVSTWDCTALDIRIWNSTFNGSPTLPLNQVTCATGDNSPPVAAKITYLTVDPRTTGEMHPMFGAVVVNPPPPPPPPPPVVGFGIGAKIKTITSLKARAAGDPAAVILCTKAIGALGTIIGGPVVTAKGTWWQINFDKGCDGWTVQADNRLLLQ